MQKLKWGIIGSGSITHVVNDDDVFPVYITNNRHFSDFIRFFAVFMTKR